MKYLFSFVVWCCIFSFAKAQESEPFSFWWRGSIAGAAFEMQVNLDFSKENDGCVPLSGTYFYLSTFKPMVVEGKYCPAAKTLTIRRNDENGLPKETFTFSNYNGKKAVGTWTKDNRAESVEIEIITGKEHFVFLDKAAEFEKGWLVHEPQTTKMFYDIPPDANMEGDLSFLSYARGVRIETLFSGTYEEEHRIYQQLPNEQALTVMSVSAREDFRMEFDDATEELKRSYCEYTLFVEVWQYADGRWKQLFGDNLFDFLDEGSSCGVFYALSSSKSVAYIGGDKSLVWDWDGKQFNKRK